MRDRLSGANDLGQDAPKTAPRDRSSVEIAESEFGLRSTEVAWARYQRGLSILRTGKAADAQIDFGEALQILRARLGDLHPGYLTILPALSTALRDQGQQETAALWSRTHDRLRIAVRVFSQRELQGHASDAVLRLEQQADELWKRQRRGEAISLAGLAAKLASQLYCAADVAQLRCAQRLAAFNYESGSYREARSIVVEVLAKTPWCDRELPLAFADIYELLGAACCCLGEFEEAKSAFESGLNALSEGIGFNEPRTAQAFVRLAWLYREMGDYTASSEFCAKADQALSRSRYASLRDRAGHLSAVASVLKELGHLAEAAEALFQTKSYCDSVGQQTVHGARYLCSQAEIMMLGKRWAAAMPVYADGLSIWERTGGAHVEHARSAIGYADCCLSMNQTMAAARAYKKASELLERTAGEAHPDNQLCALGLLLCDPELPSSVALERVEEALARLRLGLRPRHPKLAQGLLIASKVFHRARRLEDATRLIAQALNMLGDPEVRAIAIARTQPLGLASVATVSVEPS